MLILKDFTLLEEETRPLVSQFGLKLKLIEGNIFIEKTPLNLIPVDNERLFSLMKQVDVKRLSITAQVVFVIDTDDMSVKPYLKTESEAKKAIKNSILRKETLNIGDEVDFVGRNTPFQNIFGGTTTIRYYYLGENENGDSILAEVPQTVVDINGEIIYYFGGKTIKPYEKLQIIKKYDGRLPLEKIREFRAV